MHGWRQGRSVLFAPSTANVSINFLAAGHQGLRPKDIDRSSSTGNRGPGRVRGGREVSITATADVQATVRGDEEAGHSEAWIRGSSISKKEAQSAASVLRSLPQERVTLIDADFLASLPLSKNHLAYNNAHPVRFSPRFVTSSVTLNDGGLSSLFRLPRRSKTREPRANNLLRDRYWFVVLWMALP